MRSTKQKNYKRYKIKMSKILYITKEQKKLWFKAGYLYLDNDLIIQFPITSYFKKIASKIRILTRLLRLEPRNAVFLTNDLIIVAFLHKLFVISIKLKKIITILDNRNGFSNPLNFCSMRNFGKEEVYWGDYGQNNNHEAINIYKYTPNDGITIVHTFKPGDIKHVHNIIFDKYRNSFLIFTGDFETKAGIYQATYDFSEIKPLLIGSQKYRAVQGIVFKNELIYATDAVMENNYIFSYSFATQNLTVLEELNGSVIYGTLVNDGIIFSTTVEPYPSSKSKIKTLLDNRKGKGIKSNHIDLYYISADKEIKRLHRFKKDLLPMRLFQYGAVTFPYYENQSTTSIYTNPIATTKYDGKNYIINL